MKSSTSVLLLFGIVLALISTEVFAHSYLTNPTSRSNQKQTTTGCRGPSCLGPCDISLSKATRAAINVQRGASISLQWPRNNHAGGFIRVAWAQTSQSDSAAAFDAGVQEISCHERGACKPDSASDPNGGDSNPSDGSSNPCSLSITVPSHLTDGKWTLQWAWFGGAFELGDYYSCVDYAVSGGNAVTAQQSAFFVGGDYTYPNQQKCKFFNTDRLHSCVNEPCNNPVYSSGERSGAPFGVTNSAPTPTPSPPPPSPTPPPPTPPPATPVTTKKASTPPPSPTPPPPTPTPPPSSVTTGKQSTPTPPPSNTGSVTDSTSMCYLPGTPNLGGKIHRNPPYCGINGRKYRCQEGQCCSQFGYCGPIKESDGNYYDYINGRPKLLTAEQAFGLYCNNSYADYRKYSCSSLGLTPSQQHQQETDEAGMGYDDDSLNHAVNHYVSVGLIAMAVFVAFLLA